MTEILRTIAVGAALALSSTTALARPTPLCERPEVLQEVARRIKAWNVYNAIDESTVAEAPTTRPNAVMCQAVVTSLSYVSTPAGWETRPSRALHRYEVQVTGNRFFVQISP